MLITLATIAMVFEDVLSVLLVQAEARDRAVLSGVLDSIAWAFSMVVTVATVDVMQGHHNSVKVLAVGAITIANFVGSLVGVQIGKRTIKTRRINDAAVQARTAPEAAP